MTLENCKRLLEHYEKVGNKEAAEEMRKRIQMKGGSAAPKAEAKPVKK